jgi:hypothetical protein
MGEYRLYYLEGGNRINLAEWITADNDREAVEKARSLRRAALKCEVWKGQQLVAQLDANDLAPISSQSAFPTEHGAETAHPMT